MQYMKWEFNTNVFLARPRGFEPLTLGLENLCSIKNPFKTNIRHKIIQQNSQKLYHVVTWLWQEICSRIFTWKKFLGSRFWVCCFTIVYANLRSLFYYLIMKKNKSSIKELKPNKIGLRSSVSVYKTEFSEHKKMRFHNIDKIANNLAKHFKRLKPFKF